METTIQSNVDAWNAAFKRYVEFTKKTPQEALEHKVNSLGVALFEGFTAHQFGGKPRKKNVAMSELAARTAGGRGTTVRSTLLAIYQQTRTSLRAKAKALKQGLRNFGGTLDQWSGLTSGIAENQAQRISAWQDIVGREVDARQAGIGALGAAFLWYRNRGKGDARRLVLNRRGRAIGSVDVREGVAMIAGNINGLNTVDARYGVVVKAITDETNDTMTYVRRKQDEAAQRMIREAII